jgi:signal transduction histidine kinase
MEENAVLLKENEALKSENESLRAELAQLRSQVDRMQDRSSDLKEANKELSDVVHTLQDKQTNLENLQEQKDDLFAMLIHDIKSPAGIIKSLVELLKSYDLSAQEQAEIIDDLITTTTKIVSLSDEITRVLALETGNLRIDYDSIDMNIVLDDIFHRYGIKAAEKNLRFQKQYKNLPTIWADHSKIDEVISNLISNAIKYTDDGGKVTIEAKKVESAILINVHDTGLGLSRKDLEKAFQKGAQLSAVPTAGESSTGLGLWIVKKLIECHSGKVWIKSTQGVGSTFSVSLPIEKGKNSGIILDK